MAIEFGELLKENRIKVGINQEELADRCKIERTYMSKLEGEKSNPSFSTIKKLCEGLGMTPAEFFGGLREEKKPTLLLRTSKILLRELRHLRIKNEVLPIKVFNSLKSFSRHKDIKKEFSPKFIVIDKQMFYRSEDIVGYEIKGTFEFESSTLRDPIFLINVADKNIKNFGLCIMEKNNAIFLRRLIELPPIEPLEIYFVPLDIDNYDKLFSKEADIYERKKGGGRVFIQNDLCSFGINEFDKATIRGKVVGIIAKLQA